MVQQKVKLLMLACVCLAMISACGMQGDLYLPEDKAGESQQNGSN